MARFPAPGIDAMTGGGAASVLICNVIGAFTLSAAISFRARPLSEIENFISVGFCGGFSIFATFSKVSVRFLQDGEYLKFAANRGGKSHTLHLGGLPGGSGRHKNFS